LLADCVELSADTRHVADLEMPIAFMVAMNAGTARDFDAARPLFESVLALARTDGDLHTMHLSIRYLGYLARERGDVEQACALHAEALRLALDFGDEPCTLYALAGLTYISVEAHESRRAARLLSVVARLQELTGMRLSPSSRPTDFEDCVATVQTLLGEQDFAEAWAEGRALPLERAISEALQAPAAAGVNHLSKAALPPN
jgi:hypothetical protein